ncbi:hypothetical protein ACIAD0938 [Acinetobacter baylyi ADP1]|uniref:Uncharacterized protein n=1 Tax=Acinetobacter baylyi (strain ATCC 33305 / BD413 / ADP1) TaxID=62977 RepID=Q6FDM5_ACIAD|nr:hypothetical protein ACIAD0938 [Acinetobacter baylyi ADP1]
MKLKKDHEGVGNLRLNNHKDKMNGCDKQRNKRAM